MTKISQAFFRYRDGLLVTILLLGFWAPLDRMGGQHVSSTWLVLAGLLAQHHLLPIEEASIAVVVLATLLALAAAVLRTWAAAYLGSGVVKDAALHGEQIVADGPYRYLRNPLYLGTELHVLALTILMPPGGAVFALVAISLRFAVLIHAEEQYLTAEKGEAYRAYQHQVPSIFPRLFPRDPAGGQSPHWGQAVLGEIYMWGVALTYAALGYRYNAMLLTQGVLICFGVSLVVRAFLGKSVVETSPLDAA